VRGSGIGQRALATPERGASLQERNMDTQHVVQQSIRENLVAMLDVLSARLQVGSTSEDDYARTLNYLRFKIGEDLYEAYGTPLAKSRAVRLKVMRG
jgi:hypothetical protein